ncbi:hypothetical protein Lser_V15G14367 [Lactuca serriola]
MINNPSSSSGDDDIYFQSLMEAVVALMSQECESLNIIKRTRNSINMNSEAAHTLLVRDYVDNDCVYNNAQFKRRFRINKRLFMRIMNDLEANYEYFQWRYDARGRLGFSHLQKCTIAVRILAYDNAADAQYDYLKMYEKTVQECVYTFCECVRELYSEIYLRKPTRSDVEQL